MSRRIALGASFRASSVAESMGNVPTAVRASGATVEADLGPDAYYRNILNVLANSSARKCMCKSLCKKVALWQPS